MYVSAAITVQYYYIGTTHKHANIASIVRGHVYASIPIEYSKGPAMASIFCACSRLGDYRVGRVAEKNPKKR